jgi:iron complex transport system substrate-binding protein
MRANKHRCPFIFASFVVFYGASARAQWAGEKVVDSAGREVVVPERISRALAAGPPASTLLYTLAPEKMIGWVRTPAPAEKQFFKESVRDLPEHGRLTGRGTANIENVSNSRRI